MCVIDSSDVVRTVYMFGELLGGWAECSSFQQAVESTMLSRLCP